MSSALAQTAAPFAGDPREAQRTLRGRELAVVALFWVLFALVTFANRALDPRRPGPDVLSPAIWRGLLALSSTQAALWAVFTVPLFMQAARVIFARRHRAVQIMLLVAAGIVAAVIVASFADAVRESLFPRPVRTDRPAVPHSLITLGGFQFINDIVIAMGVMAAGLARAFSLSSRIRAEQTVRLQAQLAEARLDALRRQLDPHFLFNTLHAVNSLVERDPKGVRRMISRLSELLRYNIDGSSEPELPLARELELLGRYIDIMQVRFQGRLDVQVRAGEDVQRAMVPAMMLQPLVENAVTHGIERTSGAGSVVISADRDGDALVLRVRDSGPGVTLEINGVMQARGRGVGVRNTVERLAQLYGADGRFTLQTSPEGGAVAEVRLPFHVSTAVPAHG